MRKHIENNSKAKLDASVSFVLPAKIIATIAGADVELVKKVRNGTRGTGKKAQRVAMVDTMLHDRLNELVQEISKV